MKQKKDSPESDAAEEERIHPMEVTMVGALTEGGFRSLLHCLVMHADTVFPYLTSVLSDRMAPDFAADQAAAAPAGMWDTDVSEGEE